MMTVRKEDDDITQDINILRTNSVSRDYPVSLFEATNSLTGS